MDRFFEALFIGLSSGAIYALVALGIVVVFRGSGHLNFAQGEMATLSAYIAWLATTWTIPGLDSDIPLWAATIFAMVFGFAIGARLRAAHRATARAPVAPGRVRGAHRRVPRDQRVQRRHVGRPPARDDRQPVPRRAGRLHSHLRHHLAMGEHRNARRRARRERVALPVVPEDEGRPGDEGGGQQHRLRQARRDPDELRSSPARGGLPVPSRRSPARCTPVSRARSARS